MICFSVSVMFVGSENTGGFSAVVLCVCVLCVSLECFPLKFSYDSACGISCRQ